MGARNVRRRDVGGVGVESVCALFPSAIPHSGFAHILSD